MSYNRSASTSEFYSDPTASHPSVIEVQAKLQVTGVVWSYFFLERGCNVVKGMFIFVFCWLLLPPTNKVLGKVKFSQVFVFVHRGGWLLSMHHMTGGRGLNGGGVCIQGRGVGRPELGKWVVRTVLECFLVCVKCSLKKKNGIVLLVQLK